MGVLAGSVEDLVLLAEVVEAGGFSAASARCGVPKSRLSRRVAHLEQRLGIALIRRDARHFEVTEVGRQLASQGMAIRALAQQAENVVGDLQDEPTGTLAVACPVAIATFVLPRFVSAFIRRYPRVTLTISTTTGMVESLAERFDVVIHPAARQLPDSTMIARRLHVAPFVLVRAAGLGPALDDPMALTQCEVLGWEYLGSQTRWNLVHTDGRCLQVPVTPRLISDNLVVLLEAALAGSGVAPMSTLLCADDLAAGRLEVVSHGWSPPAAVLYAVHASRPAVSMAARVFIDELRAFLEAAYGGA